VNGGLLVAGVILSLLATAVPTLGWAAIVWWCDRFEREPIPLVLAAFFWGAVPAVVLALLAEMAMGDGPAGLAGQVVSTSGVAPVAEEFAKAAMLLLILLFWPGEMDDMLDGILYGAMVGFGFGMTENFLYSLQALAGNGWAAWAGVVVLRNLIFGLNHAFFTAFAGAGLGWARMTRGWLGRYGIPLVGLAVAIGVHAVHNLGASLADLNAAGLLLSLANDCGGILLVAVMLGLAMNQERRWLRVELAGEVGLLFTQEEYTALLNLRSRWGMLRVAYHAGGLSAMRATGQFQQVATELAFRKHRLAARGPDAATTREIDRLTARLNATRTQLGWSAV
jgi:protease PrsW